MDDEFYVSLVSNASTLLYSDNSSSAFVNQLATPLDLKGNYEVCLNEIVYPLEYDKTQKVIFSLAFMSQANGKYKYWYSKPFTFSYQLPIKPEEFVKKINQVISIYAHEYLEEFTNILHRHEKRAIPTKKTVNKNVVKPKIHERPSSTSLAVKRPSQPESEPQPHPKPEPQPHPKPEPRPKPKPEPRPQPKPEPQPQPKLEPQPQPKLEPRPQLKPEPQSEPKLEPEPQPRPQFRPQSLITTPPPSISIEPAPKKARKELDVLPKEVKDPTVTTEPSPTTTSTTTAKTTPQVPRKIQFYKLDREEKEYLENILAFIKSDPKNMAIGETTAPKFSLDGNKIKYSPGKGRGTYIGIRIENEQFIELMGFMRVKFITYYGTKDMVADYEPHLNKVAQLMFIYSDIIHGHHVGDKMSECLRVVPLTKTTSEDVGYLTFPTEQFFPARTGRIDSIAIKICDEFGEPIPFKGLGKVYVSLKFRKMPI